MEHRGEGLYANDESFDFMVDFFGELVEMRFDFIEHLMEISRSSY